MKCFILITCFCFFGNIANSQMGNQFDEIKLLDSIKNMSATLGNKEINITVFTSSASRANYKIYKKCISNVSQKFREVSRDSIYLWVGINNFSFPYQENCLYNFTLNLIDKNNAMAQKYIIFPKPGIETPFIYRDSDQKSIIKISKYTNILDNFYYRVTISSNSSFDDSVLMVGEFFDRYMFSNPIIEVDEIYLGKYLHISNKFTVRHEIDKKYMIHCCLVVEGVSCESVAITGVNSDSEQYLTENEESNANIFAEISRSRGGYKMKIQFIWFYVQCIASWILIILLVVIIIIIISRNRSAPACKQMHCLKYSFPKYDSVQA